MGDISLLFAVEAEQLLLAGYFDEAIELCEKGVKEYPEYPTALGILSLAYKEKGETETALSTIKDALERFPSNKSLKIIYEKITNPPPKEEIYDENESEDIPIEETPAEETLDENYLDSEDIDLDKLFINAEVDELETDKFDSDEVQTEDSDKTPESKDDTDTDPAFTDDLETYEDADHDELFINAEVDELETDEFDSDEELTEDNDNFADADEKEADFSDDIEHDETHTQETKIDDSEQETLDNKADALDTDEDLQADELFIEADANAPPDNITQKIETDSENDEEEILDYDRIDEIIEESEPVDIGVAFDSIDEIPELQSERAAESQDDDLAIDAETTIEKDFETQVDYEIEDEEDPIENEAPEIVGVEDNLNIETDDYEDVPDAEVSEEEIAPQIIDKSDKEENGETNYSQNKGFLKAFKKQPPEKRKIPSDAILSNFEKLLNSREKYYSRLRRSKALNPPRTPDLVKESVETASGKKPAKILTEFDRIAEKLKNAKISKPEDDAPQSVPPTKSSRCDTVVTETLAMIYERQGAIDAAIKAYETLAKENPDKAEEFYDRVHLLMNRDISE